MPKRPGQPTKYRKEFHGADFIRLSKLGKNITQIAFEWDVDRGIIYDWAKRHKEFNHAIKKGRDFAEGWYVNLGQLAMLGQAQVNGQKVKIDVGMFVWLTKNLFKWTEKVAVDTPTDLEDKSAAKEKQLTQEERKELIKVARGDKCT